MKERGKFVVFEGVGGSGKTEQISRSAEYLRSLGREVTVTREPGGVESAEWLREFVFKLKSEKLANADHQLALFMASRYILQNGLIIPNLEQGVDIIKDRGNGSTGAYQGYAEGGDLDVIEQMARTVMGEYKPNAIFLLDVSVETSMARNSKNKDGDPFDDEGKEYFSRVIEGYREMASNNWSGVPWYIIDAEQSIEEVQGNVQDILKEVIFS